MYNGMQILILAPIEELRLKTGLKLIIHTVRNWLNRDK